MKSPSNDDVLTVSTGQVESPVGTESDDNIHSPLTPLSSEENTPKHLMIHQQIESETGNIMVLGPDAPVIIEPPLVDGDYANQEVISKAVADAEGDYADQKIGAIHGAAPIRSRTLTPEQCDYINQEVLDGDIIPLALVEPPSVSEDATIKAREMDTRDYVNVDRTVQVDVSNETKRFNEVQEAIPTLEVQSNTLTDPLGVLQSQYPNCLIDRSSMSPVDDRETALDFRGGSPHLLAPDQRALKPSISSGCSSGATTPGALSLDGDDGFLDTKEVTLLPQDEALSVGSGFNRVAASVRNPIRSRNEEVRKYV